MNIKQPRLDEIITSNRDAILDRKYIFGEREVKVIYKLISKIFDKYSYQLDNDIVQEIITDFFGEDIYQIAKYKEDYLELIYNKLEDSFFKYARGIKDNKKSLALEKVLNQYNAAYRSTLLKEINNDPLLLERFIRQTKLSVKASEGNMTTQAISLKTYEQWAKVKIKLAEKGIYDIESSSLEDNKDLRYKITKYGVLGAMYIYGYSAEQIAHVINVDYNHISIKTSAERHRLIEILASKGVNRLSKRGLKFYLSVFDCSVDDIVNISEEKIKFIYEEMKSNKIIKKMCIDTNYRGKSTFVMSKFQEESINLFKNEVERVKNKLKNYNVEKTDTIISDVIVDEVLFRFLKRLNLDKSILNLQEGKIRNMLVEIINNSPYFIEFFVNKRTVKELLSNGEVKSHTITYNLDLVKLILSEQGIFENIKEEKEEDDKIRNSIKDKGVFYTAMVKGISKGEIARVVNVNKIPLNMYLRQEKIKMHNKLTKSGVQCLTQYALAFYIYVFECSVEEFLDMDRNQIIDVYEKIHDNPYLKIAYKYSFSDSMSKGIISKLNISREELIENIRKESKLLKETINKDNIINKKNCL